MRRWPLLGILTLAAAHFLWRLGAPSLFVDEALSVQHARPGFSQIMDVVARTETTPYTYFFGLHEWMGRTGSQADWTVRLPSVVAGVLLVGATYWTARAFVAERTALGAALLCALSPFVLQYAQQARVYVFVMLATTVAVGATVRGARAELSPSGMNNSARERRWLWVGGAAAVLALLCHYTATFALAPLAVWLATRRAVDVRARAAYVVACLAAEALLLPLLLDQYRAAPEGGELADAGLTVSALARLFSVPFDGRWFAGADWLRWLAVLATVGAALLVLARGRATVRDRRLLLAIGFAAPAGLVLAGVLGKDVLITRYAAAAVPVLLVAVAAAVAARPPLALLVAVVVAAGLVRTHVPASGDYAPARPVIAYIADRAQPGDAVVVPGGPGTDIPLGYYAERRGLMLPFVSPADSAAVLARGGRVWIVRSTEEPAPTSRRLIQLADDGLRAAGYRAAAARAFDASLTFLVVLAVPSG